MPLGISDLKRVIVLPGNWDLAYLRRFNNKEGAKTNFEQLAREIGAGFTAFNMSLKVGYWSRFITITTQPGTEYGIGNGNERLPRLAEHSVSDPITGDFGGHMLPMYDFGGSLAWTYWALRRDGLPRFQRDINALIQRSRNSWEYELINRLFSKAAVKVAGSGKSLPFADGGVSDPDFVAQGTDGNVFDGSLNHFRRYSNDAAGHIQYLAEAGSTMKKHGFSGMLDLVVGDVDKASWTALDDPNAKFIKPGRDFVLVTNGVETRARVDESEYIGAIETPDAVFQVRPTSRVPAAYAHTSKPMGLNNPANPVAVRHEDGYELGLTLIGDIKHFPFEMAQAVFTFGDGINNRVNGFNGKFAAAGAYTDPTIS